MRILATWAIMSFAFLISTTTAGADDELPTELRMEKQIMCLAKNIYYEAGMESQQGKFAVAQVTVNRVNSGKFPSTVCGVVNQRTQVAGKIVCQFNWTCNPVGKIKYVSERWQQSVEVATAVIIEGTHIDQLNNALYFHNTQAHPGWGLQRVARIDNHIFYSDKKDRLTNDQK